MNGEFNGHCAKYYRLTQQLEKEQAYLNKFLNNAPFYQGETELSEIDLVIKYYRKTQAVKAAVDKTVDKLNRAARDILYLMQYFNIPANTVLKGVIEEEAEFEIWADETDQVHVLKTKELAPPENSNVIIIRIANSASGIFDDEDEWFPK